MVFEVEIRPARNFEKALRAQFGLVWDGKTTDKAVRKNLFELALIYELSESFEVGMPLSVQKGIFGALARIGRWRGYDPEFSKYTKPDGPAEGRTPPPSGRSLGPLTALAAMFVLLLLLWRRGHGSGRK